MSNRSNGVDVDGRWEEVVAFLNVDHVTFWCVVSLQKCRAFVFVVSTGT